MLYKLKEPGTPIAAWLCLFVSWICILGGALFAYFGIVNVEGQETILFITFGISFAIMGAPIGSLGIIASNSEKTKHYQRYMAQVLETWDKKSIQNVTEEDSSFEDNVSEDDSTFKW